MNRVSTDKVFHQFACGQVLLVPLGRGTEDSTVDLNVISIGAHKGQIDPVIKLHTYETIGPGREIS